MKLKLTIIFLVLISALGVLAQQPDRIQQHVRYLASEALEGRRTGTKGAMEAARYIAAEFSRLGLKRPEDEAIADVRRQRTRTMGSLVTGR